MFRPNRKYALSIFLLLATISIAIYAKNTGKVVMTLKNSDEGCACHGDMFKSVNVSINGPAAMKTGETADFSITITGGPMLNGGINAAASAGNFTEGPGTKVMKGELTHFEPKLPKDGKLVFNFKYTAPDKPGNVTLYANGLSGNKNDSKKGDMWNHAPNKTIVIKPAKLHSPIIIFIACSLYLSRQWVILQNRTLPGTPVKLIYYF